MAEVVDSIVAELIARVDGYVANFDKATSAHDRFLKSTDKLKTQTFDLNAEGQKYKAGANAIGQAEEGLTARVTRTRKMRTDMALASDEREVASAKKAAQAKVDAEAAAQARIKAMVDRSPGVNRRPSGTGGASLGALVPREQTGQRSIPLSTLNGPASEAIAAESTINHLLADQFDLQQRIKSASGGQKRELQDQLDLIRRLNAYKAAGLTEEEAAIRAEKEILALEVSRGAAIRRRIAASAGQFAEGAGLRRTGGSGAAVTGIAAVAGVAISAEIIQKAAAYGNELATVSKELGVTTLQLQTFQAVAREAGVSNDQLTTGLGQLANNLGKAKEGSEQQLKIFKALGIDITDVANAGELLPTLIERISSIKEESKRAAVETALFGETGRKLDGLLSGGINKVNDLARSLIQTGHALSDPEIKRLDETSRKIASLKAELGVDVSRVVAANADGIEKLASALASVTAAMIGFLGSNPEKGLAILGALIGLRAGGLPGAAIGGVAGYIAGRNLGTDDLDGPTTPQRSKDIPIIYAGGGGAKALPGGKYYLDEDGNKLQVPAGMSVDKSGRIVSSKLGGGVQDGSVDYNKLGKVFAPKPNEGPQGKSADTLAREAAAREKAYQDQLARLTDDELRARSDQTQDEFERLDIKDKLLANDLERQRKDIKAQVDEKRLDGDRAKLLLIQLKNTEAQQKSAINLERVLEGLKRDYDIQNKRLDISEADLQTQQDLATTNAERKRIALALLDIDRQRETLGANYTKTRADNGDPSVTTSEVRAADLTLKTQDKRFAGRTSSVNNQYLSPFAAYRRQLSETTDDTNAALESIAVNGLGRLEDQLASTIGNVLGLKGAFGDLVASVLTDLAKLELEKGFLKIFGGGDSSSHSSGGLGGIIGAVLGAFGGKHSHGISPGFSSSVIQGARAGGGPVTAGRWLVGERGPEIIDVAGSGRVYPNGALPPAMGSGGAMTVQQHIHVDGRNSVTPANFADQILAVANRHANKVAAQAGRTAVDASPARASRLGTLGS